jgi:hypothetical protein
MSVSELADADRQLMRERVFAWMSADGGLASNLVSPAQRRARDDDAIRGWVESAVSCALPGNLQAQTRVLTREAAAALRRGADDCSGRVVDDGPSALECTTVVADMMTQLRTVWDLLETSAEVSGPTCELYVSAHVELITVFVLCAVKSSFAVAQEEGCLDAEGMRGLLEDVVATHVVPPSGPTVCPPALRPALVRRAASLVSSFCAGAEADAESAAAGVAGQLALLEALFERFSVKSAGACAKEFWASVQLDDCWLVHMLRLEKDVSEGRWVRQPSAAAPVPVAGAGGQAGANDEVADKGGGGREGDVDDRNDLEADVGPRAAPPAHERRPSKRRLPTARALATRRAAAPKKGSSALRAGDSRPRRSARGLYLSSARHGGASYEDDGDTASDGGGGGTGGEARGWGSKDDSNDNGEDESGGEEPVKAAGRQRPRFIALVPEGVPRGGSAQMAIERRTRTRVAAGQSTQDVFDRYDEFSESEERDGQEDGVDEGEGGEDDGGDTEREGEEGVRAGNRGTRRSGQMEAYKARSTRGQYVATGRRLSETQGILDRYAAGEESSEAELARWTPPARSRRLRGEAESLEREESVSRRRENRHRPPRPRSRRSADVVDLRSDADREASSDGGGGVEEEAGRRRRRPIDLDVPCESSGADEDAVYAGGPTRRGRSRRRLREECDDVPRRGDRKRMRQVVEVESDDGDGELLEPRRDRARAMRRSPGVETRHSPGGAGVRSVRRRAEGVVTSLNVHGFNRREDEELVELVHEHGYGKWDRILAAGRRTQHFLPHRTRSQVHKRAQEIGNQLEVG